MPRYKGLKGTDGTGRVKWGGRAGEEGTGRGN